MASAKAAVKKICKLVLQNDCAGVERQIIEFSHGDAARISELLAHTNGDGSTLVHRVCESGSLDILNVIVMH